MGRILSSWRVIVATLFSVALVAGAYLLARGFGAPAQAEASSETELLQAIAARDTDGDSLPDWQEVLYGTDPRIVDTFHLGMTDGEAVEKGLIVPKAVASVPTASSTDQTPTTLTDSFAQLFFTKYLEAKQGNNGVDLSAAQVDALASDLVTQLGQADPSTASYKTTAAMTVSGTGDAALRAYAAHAEGVMKQYSATSAMSEFDILKAAVFDNDPDALKELAVTAEVYRNYAEGFAQIGVPQELLAAHTALINAFMLRSSVNQALSQTNTDPLAAMIALQKLDASESEMWRQLSAIATVYAVAGTTFRGSDVGAGFVTLLVSAKQRTI